MSEETKLGDSEQKDELCNIFEVCVMGIDRETWKACERVYLPVRKSSASTKEQAAKIMNDAFDLTVHGVKVRYLGGGPRNGEPTITLGTFTMAVIRE